MYTSIVVGTDGSATARAAVGEAHRLAKECSAQVHVVTAYKMTGTLAAAGTWATGAATAHGAWDESAQLAVAQQLEEAAGPMRHDGLKVETYAIPGDAAAAIVQVAESTDADLVIVGSKGMQGARRVLGSVPNSVAHNAPCSVLVFKTC